MAPSEENKQMSTSSIEFDLTGIGKELKETLLAVPIYQRSYAWTEEEVSEYWSDLEQAQDEGASEYFLGTVVLTKQALGNRDTIIDGSSVSLQRHFFSLQSEMFIEKEETPRGPRSSRRISFQLQILKLAMK